MRLKVLLVSNYTADKQESMLRFADILEQELKKRGLLYARIEPKPLFGKWARNYPSLSKWLGYLDKLFVFPFFLKAVLRVVPASQPLLVHICDHSNAFCSLFLQKTPHLVTCNDLIAIKSALGKTPEHQTRFTGKMLQWVILKGLKKAKRITCISKKSLQDLIDIAQVDKHIASYTYMGFNYPYTPLAKEAAAKRVQDLLPKLTNPYIFYVGSDAWYKNKQGLLYLFKELQALQTKTVDLVLAGPPPAEMFTYWIKENHFENRVHFICNVNNEDLRALYSKAELLIFPSLYEGFGWPVLEAQACGCPVIATEIAPLTEVGGTAARYMPSVQSMKDLDTWAEVSAEIVAWTLNQPEQEREKQIEAGLENSKRFSTEAMISNYCQIYEKMITEAKGG